MGIEALDGFHEPHERDLPQVVEGFATVREAPGEELGEAHVLLDELVSERAIPRPAVLHEPLLDGGVVALDGRITHGVSVAS